MDVQEIIRLADWFDKNAEDAILMYNAVTEHLQHNVEQENSFRLQEAVEMIVDVLNEMPTEELTRLQNEILSNLGVASVIGKSGAKWIKETLELRAYDPTTIFAIVQNALSRLLNARTKIDAFRAAAIEVGAVSEEISENNKDIKISIIFRGGVSISNIRDWKTTAADWEKIFHGLAVVADDKPEDVKIVGFENGSLILKLVATPVITKLLAMISKHITGIAQDIILVQTKREELKQLRLITKTMEKEFEMLKENKIEKGREAIISELDRQFPKLDPETKNKVSMSINKAIAFGQAGGEIDFSMPDTLSENAMHDENGEIRRLIEENNKIKQQPMLLDDNTKNGTITS